VADCLVCDVDGELDGERESDTSFEGVFFVPDGDADSERDRDADSVARVYFENVRPV
jgi:hypothetical protein